MTDRS
jgi:chaperone BCS1